MICNITLHPGEKEQQVRPYVEQVAKAIDFSLLSNEKLLIVERLGNHLGYNITYQDGDGTERKRHYNEAQVKALLD